MIQREIAKAWSFFRENGVKQTILSREAPFLIQFGKYGVCGVLSVVVFLIVTFVGEALFPERYSKDLPEFKRAINLIPLHLVAFIPSNFTAYFLNRWLVFTPGRHQFKKEMTLFTIISFISFGLGELITFLLVTGVSVNNTVNFVCRKFLVFEK
jgi:putative flippase GtrA